MFASFPSTSTPTTTDEKWKMKNQPLQIHGWCETDNVRMKIIRVITSIEPNVPRIGQEHPQELKQVWRGSMLDQEGFNGVLVRFLFVCFASSFSNSVSPGNFGIAIQCEGSMFLDSFGAKGSDKVWSLRLSLVKGIA